VLDSSGKVAYVASQYKEEHLTLSDEAFLVIWRC